MEFQQLDLDGDGVISQEELAAALDWDAVDEAVAQSRGHMTC